MSDISVIEPITIELPDEGGDPTVVVTLDNEGGAVVDPPPVRTEDPEGALADLRRKLEESEKARELEAERRQREQAGRIEAEQRAARNAGDADQARVQQISMQFDSITNALTASEREMENLQTQKAGLLERGEFAEATKLDSAMARVGGRIAQFEMAKETLERQREQAKAPPPDPALSAASRNEEWLAGIPAPTAHWVRQHPEFFANASFQKRVLDAAEYAERVKALKPTNPDYFRFIEEETGLRAREAPQPAVTPAAPASAAATVVERQAAPPAPRPAPIPAAAPNRAVPDSAHPNGGGRATVTLSAAEREMARAMFPRRRPTDPDPDVLYAKNKLALEAEGKIGPRARHL